MGDNIQNTLVGVIEDRVIQTIDGTGLQGIQHLRTGDHDGQCAALFIERDNRGDGRGADLQAGQVRHLGDGADDVAHLTEAVAVRRDADEAVLLHNLGHFVGDPALEVVFIRLVVVSHQTGQPCEAQCAVQHAVHGHIVAHQHIQRTHLQHLCHVGAVAQRACGDDVGLIAAAGLV